MVCNELQKRVMVCNRNNQRVTVCNKNNQRVMVCNKMIPVQQTRCQGPAFLMQKVHQAHNGRPSAVQYNRGESALVQMVLESTRML